MNSGSMAPTCGTDVAPAATAKAMLSADNIARDRQPHRAKNVWLLFWKSIIQKVISVKIIETISARGMTLCKRREEGRGREREREEGEGRKRERGRDW
jgi:hypothetical protein